ncbi:hypothetical protein CHS0354_042868 [Potamilus streckersoni]|uniref:PH domain-containing protein n=1 Tax=Potamilus streckersoni TaxID=2493646 RepID=A0AAE0T4V2_9BIVA|nr:hypothetical protein CHS0354_042868 [Potamilus streckersoni]
MAYPDYPRMSSLFWAGWRTIVEKDMPMGSNVETVSNHSTISHVSSNQGSPRSKMRSKDSIPSYGTEAWWYVRDYVHGDRAGHQTVSLAEHNDDDMWDLSDSLVDLFQESNKVAGQFSEENHALLQRFGNKSDMKAWLEEDTSNGFVRVFNYDSEVNSRMFPCTLSTTAQKLCLHCGMPPNSLHVQFNGDIIRRLEPFDCPLAIQNDYLQNIGYSDLRRIQEIGAHEDLPYLVKFYAGKPISDSTYSRNQLSTMVYVRKGKIIYQWVQRLCVISGTRLHVYRDKNKTTKPTIVQLAKGTVEEYQTKGHDFCLKLTSSLQGERSVYLSFSDEKDYNKWLRKTKKATAKLPTKADLSNCHLEFLPETVFINEELEYLNLRHNVLKERPIEEDIYTIGWLDDLPRFQNLRSLNLADNELHVFPMAICKMKMLTELNVASNKITQIPPDIIGLENLQLLHVHNNHLSSLPEEVCRMKNLMVLVLAFNRFTTIPSVLLHTHDTQNQVDSFIMAGNMVDRMPHEVLNRMKHIKKIDLRMNRLSFMPSEMAKFHLLEHVTHLDVRDNHITDLDIRALRSLEYLNCERNQIHTLQVNGSAIKSIFAKRNDIINFSINPKPEWLLELDLSYNQLLELPNWLSDCFFMTNLNASHNQLMELPDRLLTDAQKLKVLHVSHNCLKLLPEYINSATLEEISLEHNQLSSLPDEFFTKMPKLRYLCLTHNDLVIISPPQQNVYQNKLTELYISANHLTDDAVPLICNFSRLKVLHMAHNDITEIHDRDFRKLENLQELNISGNKLRHLPRSIGRHPKLQILRANANLLKELPDFRQSTNLKVLDVGSNRLFDVSVTNLMSSQINLLDISGNPEMQVDTNELKGIKSKKKVCIVDIKGQNRSLLDLRTAVIDDLDKPWKSGLSQTSGIRNKISVMVINKPGFNNGKEGLFAVMDGGRTDEVSKLLSKKFQSILTEEQQNSPSSKDYLKYAMLASHRCLKAAGQKLGATAAICHIVKQDENSNHYVLNVANVGDVEVVLCRRGEAVCLTRLFTIQANKEECKRICKSDGIITEDNKINGVTHNSRLLGNSYLFPHVIPDPYTSSTVLQPEDQLIIVANQGFWNFISYQEAVNEIVDIPDPALAAKKLQDLAQGYKSQENIAILVVQLLFYPIERNRIKALIQMQYQEEQQVLAALKRRDAVREEIKKQVEEEDSFESVPMEIVKLRDGRKRGQLSYVFNKADVNGSADITDSKDAVSSKAHLQNKIKGKTVVDIWEEVLQKRLAEEVKDKEMKHVMQIGKEEEDVDADVGSDGQNSDNWSAVAIPGHIKNRVVTVPSPLSVSPKKHPPPPPPCHMGPYLYGDNANHASQVSVEFTKELKHPIDVDRDAVLFYQMQLSRSKSHGASSESLDSTQSDPSFSSVKEALHTKSFPSHSIEVLMNISRLEQLQHIGGSVPQPPKNPHSGKRTTLTDSCPTTAVPAKTDRINTRSSHSDIRDLDAILLSDVNRLKETETIVKYDPAMTEVKQLQLFSPKKDRHSQESKTCVESPSKLRKDREVSKGDGGISNQNVSVPNFENEDQSNTSSCSEKEIITGHDFQDTYKKVTRIPRTNNNMETSNVTTKNVYPFVEQDLNCNSLTSLDDLLAFNRMQSQKLDGVKNASAKNRLKMTHTPPPPPSTPSNIPEPMIPDSFSQQSIIITYL